MRRVRPMSGLLAVLGLLAATFGFAGSASAQPALCFGVAVTMQAVEGVATVGTSGDDVIMGTAGADDIRGGGGDDVICGLGGPDVIRGNAGDDRIRGGPGRDRIKGGAGRDLIVGGSGADALFGNSQADTIQGMRGEDEISGGKGHDVIDGGAHADTIAGNQKNDTITGGGGHDTINGGKGDDTVAGEEGYDIVLGKTGDDTLDGGEGWDNCQGGPGRDHKESCEAKQSVGAVDWSDPTRVVHLGNGWAAAACTGNGEFLCVSRDETWSGGVAFLSYPASESPVLDPTADDDTNLRAFVAEALRSICEDQVASGLGEAGECTYQLIGPRKFDFGGLSGLRYAIRRPLDGPPDEYHVRYIAIRGDDLVIVAASSYREEGWTPETLIQARPVINVILKASPLPESRR